MRTRCQHTGLPKLFCGHCNGTQALEKPAYRGREIEDTPHLFKGRDKAEWRGYGRHVAMPDTLRDGAKAMHHATQSTLTRGSCVRPVGFSTWAQENIARSMVDSVRRKLV